jgi:HAMP domain-containing protein
MNETVSKKRIYNFSMRVKLLIGFTLLFSLIFAVAFYWFYTFATDMAMNKLKNELTLIITGTASQLNVDQFQAVLNYQDVELNADGYPDINKYPEYWAHCHFLRQVKLSINPDMGIYTYILGDPNIKNEVIFIGSSGAEKSSGVKFREHFVPVYYPETIINGVHETNILMNSYPDDWGKWISGYTPIKNANGDVIGGLGADYPATYVHDVRKAIQDKIVIAFAITYITLFLFVFYISRTLTRPITSLTRIAGQIGEGNYENTSELDKFSKGRITDEIGTLARVFGIMVGKVYQREQILRLQVEQLKIEIDQVKQQKQVSEIVETDFFKDLVEKANTIRNRSKHKE